MEGLKALESMAQVNPMPKVAAKSKAHCQIASDPPQEPVSTPTANTRRRLRATLTSPKMVAPSAKSTPVKSPECKRSKVETETQEEPVPESQEALLNAPTMILGESPIRAESLGKESQQEALPATGLDDLPTNHANNANQPCEVEIPDSQPMDIDETWISKKEHT